MDTALVNVLAFGAGSSATAPTEHEYARLAQAVAAKAARTLALAEAPLGTIGEITEWGVATVRPDYQISELLYGLRFRGWTAIHLAGLVTPADVIRTALGAEPAGFPAERVADVERAIASAISWVAEDLAGGSGIA